MHYLKELVVLGLCSVQDFNCPHCAEGLVNFEKGKVRHGVDGYPRCNKTGCMKTVSPFLVRYFLNTKLTYSCIYFTLYSYVSMDSNTQLGSFFGVSRQTLSKFHSFYNSVILNSTIHWPKLNGENVIIECDECHLYTNKNNRGRALAGQSFWVLGLICRSTKQIRLKVVTRRNSEVISNFIFDNVEITPETTFMTDGWRGYNFLSDINVTFNVINHSIHFVDPNDNTLHTNTIERVWRSLREYIPKGASKTQMEYYVLSFVVFFNRKALKIKERLEVVVEELKRRENID